jgi:hypothetical protein
MPCDWNCFKLQKSGIFAANVLVPFVNEAIGIASREKRACSSCCVSFFSRAPFFNAAPSMRAMHIENPSIIAYLSEASLWAASSFGDFVEAEVPDFIMLQFVNVGREVSRTIGRLEQSTSALFQ